MTARAIVTLGSLADLLGAPRQPFPVATAIFHAYEKMVPKRCSTCERKLTAVITWLEGGRRAGGQHGDSQYHECDDCFTERARREGRDVSEAREAAYRFCGSGRTP